MAEAPSYYAIIPANVRYDQNLPGKAILLYGEITALCNQKGYCWASNDYFAKLYGVNSKSIQRWIKNLEDQGYISREVFYKKGTKEIERRNIRLNTTPHLKNEVTPHLKNEADNTTSINKNHSEAEPKEDSIHYKKIINFLNEKAGRDFKDVEGNRKLIRARIHDGYSEHDFALVIDFKCKQWLNDEKMEKYLRPGTLFGSSKKFDQYLDEAKQNRKQQAPTTEPQGLSVGEGSARAANYLAELEKQYEGD
ncbi:conserved phage C-terminal domain-containing protein [Levilactobacillus brevis]|uniref:conserved phage C-terminal domain-containing protein n=1 Tax=Levilactobacillus brevis TaxID=1580 RepID=UPI000BE88A2C|nr:conserved phage C-terminal domain-containing protein [Levilactobacillus brevis]MCZ2118605.1 conserved phage C-terminal domain-containing protein [Levilactobacillus brevis]MCZ2124211.1 conserved phage C-terminal domain-containing protein [Levilactobacillus brevis]MCZ2208531.1 conserved phage C-terminal domain-containing protein [Levilactobacillus brevis]MCZ2323995.1 conserved phage C-terminal domain-containing protein [Levilactobacillus brevis]